MTGRSPTGPGHSGFTPSPDGLGHTASVPSALALSDSRPLRLCGYCRSWNARPCGNGCLWSFSDPTFETLEKELCGNTASGMRPREAGTAEGEASQPDGEQSEPGRPHPVNQGNASHE